MIDLGKNASSTKLPGYLNRFDGTSKGAWSGSDGESSILGGDKLFSLRKQKTWHNLERFDHMTTVPHNYALAQIKNEQNKIGNRTTTN